jgi:hypothetical protein
MWHLTLLCWGHSFFLLTYLILPRRYFFASVLEKDTLENTFSKLWSYFHHRSYIATWIAFVIKSGLVNRGTHSMQFHEVGLCGNVGLPTDCHKLDPQEDCWVITAGLLFFFIEYLQTLLFSDFHIWFKSRWSFSYIFLFQLKDMTYSPTRPYPSWWLWFVSNFVIQKTPTLLI